MYRRAVCRVVKARRRQLWENIPIEERPGSEELVRVICGSCRQTTASDILHLGVITQSDILRLGEFTESDIPPCWEKLLKVITSVRKKLLKVISSFLDILLKVIFLRLGDIIDSDIICVGDARLSCVRLCMCHTSFLK